MPRPFPRIWTNVVRPRDNHGVLELRHPDGRTYMHWFDLEFLDYVQARHWSPISKWRYARTNLGRDKFMFLHHVPFHFNGVIIPKGIQTDHIDHLRSWDSRMQNLRLVRPRVNGLNRSDNSDTPNVVFDKSRGGVYRPHIAMDGKQLYRPVIRDLELASIIANAYQKVAGLYDNNLIQLPVRAQMVRLVDRLKDLPNNTDSIIEEIFLVTRSNND